MVCNVARELSHVTTAAIIPGTVPRGNETPPLHFSDGERASMYLNAMTLHSDDHVF